MSAPTAPTSTTLVSEALAKAGHSSPSSALTTRADLWLNEIKADIWAVQKRLKSLQTTSITILTVGKSRYSNPTDYASDLSLKLLWGGVTGTASTGSSSSITLASGSVPKVGQEIVITGGTGQGGISQITAFNSGTRVATVSPNFSTAPDSTSTYMVIDLEYPVTPGPVWDFDKSYFPTLSAVPSMFYPTGDSDYGELIFDAVPDKAYAAKMRYYANLMTLDLSSTLLSTLYQKWRNVWLVGVKWKALDDSDDDRATKAEQEYISERTKMIIDETYGQNISTLSAVLAE